MKKIINNRVLSINGYFYISKKGHESNRMILLKLCDEHNLIYKAVKHVIKAERRILTKEQMLELLIISGCVWKDLDQLSTKRC